MSDEQAKEVFHWEIEPDGGNASFYPSANDNKGKTVKINGSSAGRVKINVYAGEPSANTEPAVFTEAVVVTPKVVPYRANIISHPDNTNEDLPSAFNQLPDAFNVANIILRQAGVTLEPSSDQANGDLTHVLKPENGEKEDSIQNFGSAFYIYADALKERAEDVGSGNEGDVLSINYRPNLLQISFIENFEGEQTTGRSRYRKPSALSGNSLSAAYKTSSSDTFDESMVHTLNFESGSSHPNYPDLHGVLIAWRYADDPVVKKGGQTIAHEVAHALTLSHRAGLTYDHFDGLETQQGGKLLGPKGTNVMDYGDGVDLDLLQLQILRASSIFE